MAPRCLIILATTISLCLAHFVAEGGREDVSKGVLKTIETKDGVYDCVDFYKQPAFSHPLLRNHSYHPEMRPSFVPQRPKTNEVGNEVPIIIGTKINCPKGTVPIRRLNYGDQHQMRRFNYSQLGEKHPNDSGEFRTYFTLGQSKNDVTKVYNGIAATLSVWNPKVFPSQYSLGEIIIKGGTDVIIVGWTVNPMVYGDKETRFFIYTVTGDTHCFNSQCGFVQTRFDITLDFIIKPTSKMRGTVYVLPLFVFQDSDVGDWWLAVGQNNTLIGYWPQQFFHGLFRSGNYVACVGEVSGPQKVGYPPMGSGYKPKSTFPEWSFCKNMIAVDQANKADFIRDVDLYTDNEYQNSDIYIWFLYAQMKRKMASQCLIILATTICLCLTHLVAEGGKEDRSKDNVLKTIETEGGVYECVDFYKQPALSHPLLRNHKYHPEMRPSFMPKRPKSDGVGNGVPIQIDTKLNCPKGTIPIRRLNYDHQHQMSRFNYSQLGETHPHNNIYNSYSKTYFALGQSKSDVRRVYNGISANLSVWNPNNVESSQYSSAEIIIKGGLDVIIVGWTVNPMVYGDKETRFFIYTVAGDTHCFNSWCGFIQVRRDIPLDSILKPVSVVNGTSYVFLVSVYQDPENDYWWLAATSNEIILGFWPPNFFQGLHKSGTFVACGGEVSGPSEDGYPPMGSGFKPDLNVEMSYCRNIQVVNEAHNLENIQEVDLYSDDSDHYGLYNYNEDPSDTILQFGGPEKFK